MNHAIAINPRASSYYYVLAGVYRRLGRMDESRKALEMFKRLERESERAGKEASRVGNRRDSAVAPSESRRDDSMPSPLGSRRAPPRWSRCSWRAPCAGRRSAAPSCSPTSRPRPDCSRASERLGQPGNKQFLLEEMGCGAAFFDYDHDGWLDIFLVNGTSLDPKVRDSRPTSYLFHNNRDGTFTDVSAKAGLIHSGWGQACCVGDYDNDGFDDLFVTYWGQQRPVSQQWRRHLHRCVGKSGRRRVGNTVGCRLLFPRLRP